MKRHKILFILEGGGILSQDFVRGKIYQDLFSLHGITVHYVGHEFTPPEWLLHPKSRFVRSITTSLEYRLIWAILYKIGKRINRMRIVRRAHRYDIIVLVKVSSLNLVKQIHAKSRARLVYDLSDAVWLPFLCASYPDIGEILKTVDAVTWDYKYTKEFAQNYAKEVFLWLPASQVELFDAKRANGKRLHTNSEIVLGWVGSTSTVFNLYVIFEALENIFKKYSNIRLRIIGAGIDPLVLPHFERVSYSVLPYYNSQQMVDEILKMDIGLFPLFDIEDSCVRGFLKSLVFMSGEVAVIASPRGQVPELIQDGVNGMLANSTKEWVDKLEQLITDHELRHRIATAGLETVRRDYNLKKSFEGLLSALDLDNNK